MKWYIIACLILLLYIAGLNTYTAFFKDTANGTITTILTKEYFNEVRTHEKIITNKFTNQIKYIMDTTKTMSTPDNEIMGRNYEKARELKR
jgi:hypothetical protein